MKSYLIGVILSGLIAASASAQTVGQATAKPTSAPPMHPVVAEPCCEPCPPCVKKICVLEPAKKKITKVWYDCKCEDFCLVKCPHFSLKHKHKDCNGCEVECCASCEKKVRTKNILYKRIIVKECDTVKCVPVEVPDCAPCQPTCCPTPCVIATPQPVSAEPIKAMPAPVGTKPLPPGK